MSVCVSVLSPANAPLFLHSADPKLELANQYSLHTSLDVIEEKTSSINLTGAPLAPAAGTPTRQRQGGDAAQASREPYLGVLFATEKQKVYGYVTNTRIKFILIVDSSNSTLRDNEVRQMFRRIHTAYTQLLSNPFYVPGTPIKSKRFQDTVQGMMAKQ